MALVKTKRGLPIEPPKYDTRKYTPKEILAFEKRDRELAAKEAKDETEEVEETAEEETEEKDETSTDETTTPKRGRKSFK